MSWEQFSQKVMLASHYHVHEGVSFMACWKNRDNAPVADNAIFGLLFRVGPRSMHFNFGIGAGGNCEAILLESPTVTVTGTPYSAHNLKRTYPGGTLAQFWELSTITTGTVLCDSFMAGGWGNMTAGGMNREDTEWILNPNTFYFVGGINRAGSVQDASVMAQWYEE